MSEPSVTLHLGDCLEVMRGMAGGSVDAVVTDPPYGIARVWKGGFGRGWGKADQQKSARNSWDDEPPPAEVFQAILGWRVPTVIWGGNYFALPPSRCWLVWNKPERGFTLAEAELAWTSLDAVVRVFDYRRSDPNRVHPTQKPVALMRWCIERLKLKPGSTVFDPYMGSGTTGVAAVELGFNFIGCEIDPDHYRMAEERIGAARVDRPLFRQASTRQAPLFPAEDVA